MRCFIFLLLLAVTIAKRYDGHRLIRLFPLDRDDLFEIKDLILTMGTKIDVWNDKMVEDRPVLIRVAPDHMDEMDRELNDRNIEFDIRMPDIQKVIDEQRVERRQAKHDPYNIDLQQYHPHHVIDGWLDHMISVCGSRCEIHNVGNSYYGRRMRAVRVSGTGDISARRNIWMDSAIHAREWIAPATNMWIMNEFIRNYESNPQTKAAVDRFNWYFLIVVNPDGYNRTHAEDEHPDGDRLWRKTLRPTDDPEEPDCEGADANRNFDYEWDHPDGSDDWPCSDLYAGDFAFSEPETQHVRDSVLALRPIALVSFHSFSQLWLSPWGYTEDFPPNHDEVTRVGNLTATALTAVHGTRYTVGSAADVLYTAAGITIDWSYGAANVEYSYTPELRDTGDWGFLLPPEQIQPSGEETLAGILAMAREIRIPA